MHIAVIGAGSIGGWLAAACREAGAQVTVLARGASLDVLRQDGLRLDDGKTQRRYRVEATDDPARLRGAEVLILGLKAHDLPAAAPLIARALGPETIIVPAINGLPWWFFENFGGPAQGLQIDAVDPGGVLSRTLPGERVVGTVVHAASHMTAPGCIRLDSANKVWLGDATTGRHAARIADLLAAGGIPAEETDTVHWHVWNKLWGNSNLNPLSALSRADLSQLLDDDYVRGLIAAMMKEMAEVGALIGLTGFDALDDRIATTRKLGPVRTSMLQDTEAGRPLELDPILGGLVELARHLGHPTPAMDGIYGLTRLLDRSLRS